MKKKVDGQLVELAGRNWLISQLIQGGIEVARPERDHGVDLIAYIDPPDFIAVPIQMKAFSDSAFWISKQKHKGMLLVYIWYVKESSRTVAFAMTWREGQDIFKRMGWKSDGTSWEKQGTWFTHPVAAGGRLAAEMELHRMTPDKWLAKIRVAAQV